MPSATGTTADASPLAHITRQWLRTAHQAVRYLRAGAASLRVSSASTDHPSSGDHASAPGCLAIQPSVGQCVDASAHANIHAPMTRPTRVHRCQKVGEEEGTEAGSEDGDAGDAAARRPRRKVATALDDSDDDDDDDDGNTAAPLPTTMGGDAFDADPVPADARPSVLYDSDSDDAGGKKKRKAEAEAEAE